jgi:hypothetical protein
VATAAAKKGWVEPTGSGRVLRVTPRGTAGLKRALGVSA